MTERPGLSTRRMALGLLGVLVVVVLIGGGFGNALATAGLIAVLVGSAAAVVGRARWACIASRRTAGIVAGAGVVALVVGASVATSTASSSTAGSATPEASRTTAAPTENEAAIAAAEAAVVEAETREEVAQEGGADLGTGPLTDAAADEAVTGAQPTTALAALAAIEVKGRAPRTGYDRDLFGSGWVDTDRNGCDTRNDVLARDLTGETFEPGTRDCVVMTGTLADPYSGGTIAFRRGQGTSGDVQIDHVVALSDAWQKGAQGWDTARRTSFANDSLNLLAVDGPLNMQKGDGDAATWLPPSRSYRCAYVARQVAVKATYQLWMTQAEKNAIATVLSACPNEPLPAGVVVVVPERQPSPAPPRASTPAPAPRAVPVPVPAPAPAPAPVPRPAPAPAPAPAPPASTYYANCATARAAGAAPVHRGDPGYGSHLDRDGDGVGCES